MVSTPPLYCQDIRGTVRGYRYNGGYDGYIRGNNDDLDTITDTN